MRRTACVLAVAGVVLLAGCGRAGKNASGGGDPARAAGRAGGAAAGAGGAAGGAVGARPAALPKNAALARAVVRTGTMTVRVDDVAAAAAAVTAAAERVGGYVQAADVADARGTVTVRVPPERFTATGDAAARLGTVTARHVGTEDVTADVADVDGRLAASRASAARLRALIGRAATVAEVTALESELSTREGEIESLAARRRALGDGTALATLTVTLARGAAKPAHVAAKGFGGGLHAGWAAFTAAARGGAVVAGALLPFAVAGALVAAPFVVYGRRRRTT
jgi:hypothetical protein